MQILGIERTEEYGKINDSKITLKLDYEEFIMIYRGLKEATRQNFNKDNKYNDLLDNLNIALEVVLTFRSFNAKFLDNSIEEREERE